jgi:hypothetical protein
MSGRLRGLPLGGMNYVMATIRFGLAAGLVIAGVAVAAFGVGGDGSLEGAFLFLAVGPSVLLLNALFRYGVAGDRERDEEDAAREYFDAHGYWPDEASR